MRSASNQKFVRETGFQNNNNFWGIVLAGGEGTRLSPLSKKLYGYHRPKQYCTLVGTRSLIRHTIERVRKLIPTNQILTVVNKSHGHFITEELNDMPREAFVVQPCARDTAAGILYPILKIHDKDPESIVSIFPADHFIEEENNFMGHVYEAKSFVQQNPDSIVMLGIKPDNIESGYGWIECAYSIEKDGNTKISSVSKFWEKPNPETAELLFSKQCLINTFVLVGKSASFINYIQSCLPEVYNAFDAIRSNINSPLENVFAEYTYSNIPLANFSSSVLEKITKHLCVMEVRNVHWSDWGEEYRIFNDIERLRNQKVARVTKSSVHFQQQKSLITDYHPSYINQ